MKNIFLKLKNALIGSAQKEGNEEAALEDELPFSAVLDAEACRNLPPLTREQAIQWIELSRRFRQMSEGPFAEAIEVWR
jgi:hypothetical protein